MKRYIRSQRSRKNVHDTNALRDQFLRQLTQEAEAMMKQLSEQFTREMQTQVSALTPNLVSGTTPAAPSATGDLNTIGSVSQMLATGVRYLVSRPRTSRHTEETSRSADATARFKLSQSQAAVEMQAALNRGDKNA